MSALPLFNSEHRLMTCPSCGVTYTEDDFERFNDTTFSNLHKLVNFLKSLNFTSEELIVIKAMLIFYPGIFLFIVVMCVGCDCVMFASSKEFNQTK